MSHFKTWYQIDDRLTLDQKDEVGAEVTDDDTLLLTYNSNNLTEHQKQQLANEHDKHDDKQQHDEQQAEQKHPANILRSCLSSSSVHVTSAPGTLARTDAAVAAAAAQTVAAAAAII